MTAAGLGCTPDPDDLDRLQMDPAEALSLLSSLLRRWTKHRDHSDMVARSAADQQAEITVWLDENSRADHSEMAALEQQMRPLARIVMATDPKHRKSVNTVAGEVCFREGSTSIEVTDAAAYAQWYNTVKLPRSVVDVPFLRYPPAPPPAPNLSALHREIGEGDILVNEDGSLSLKGEDGERVPIPGVRQVKAEETFTVRPR